ncbi:hypothetical protein GSI_07198 [Ganoderma sinense ZZ0214-1]|uniref:Transcription factor n=1 Tax=Ganoderma sinense ZZ0214-1 TaxID=1077348 RepID=A0A2G8SA82_9APHY|nr:hypothetical protein GSI_07198 [Ganoderma sinense ZZ0214-1]
MSGRCEECGASTVWDSDVGSAICLQCGTLADPTQSVLASHLETVDVSGRDFAPWVNVPGGSTLRGRNGWALSGQGKEGRDRKNTIAMHDFIRVLATRVSNPGLTPRAQGIFDQAMRLGKYRWGHKARLTAGAALAISLRESRKSDYLRDIAYLLNEPHTVLSRAFSKVVALLQLGLSTTDPAVHLPTLQTHLVSLLDGTGSVGPALPAQLVKVLFPLLPRLPSITDTASSLAGLLARTNAFTHLPTPPTACALLMLALEAELSASLPNAGAFAAALGTRLGAAKATVMLRYKEIYDLVEEWIREVPWLDAHERKPTKGREGKGRSKVAKRVVVARGLKDVVLFQEEIWRKRIQHDGRPLVQLDLDESDKGAVGSGDQWWDSSEAGSSNGSSRSMPVLGEDHMPPRKKAKTRHAKTVVDASQFLLNPLSAATSSPAPTSAVGSPDLLAHLLTADASFLPHAFSHVPSRLQLLASARGGTEPRHIADEELFTEDELEGLMRSPEEVEAVRTAMGWDLDDDEGVDARNDARNDWGGASALGNVGAGSSATKGEKRKRKLPDGGDGLDAGRGTKPRGSKKIDMEALARLLDPDADLDLATEDTVDTPAHGACEAAGPEDHDGEEGEEDWEEYEEGAYAADHHEDADVGYGAAEEEVVEEWRPLSPGGGGGLSEDWFEF